MREILASISRAKDELADFSHYRALASAMVTEAQDDEERLAAQKCMEVAQVYEQYESVLHDEDALDFGDLIMRPTLLLESDAALRVQLSERHRHVLVDEFQDVNRASARLLRAISGDAARLWVVGDARQSIYRFRGASPANLRSFREDFGGEAGALAINYRSTEQIVKTFCNIAMRLRASEHQLPLNLEANRGTGPAAPEMRSFTDPDAEAAGIVDSVLDLQSRGVALRDQAVLCRSNARLAAIAAALEARGLPVLHLGSLFERDDIRDLLALLSLSIDKFSASLVRVGAWPRYGLTLQDVYIAAKWLKEKDSRPLEMLAACAREAPDLSERGSAGILRLTEDLEGLSQSLMPWDYLCRYLLDRTDFLRDIASDTSIAGRMKGVAIWQFLNFVRAPVFAGTGSPVRRVLDRVRELVLLAEERGLREVPNGALHLDAVRLLTVHASKGLEFEAVHLPGLTSRAFPVQWTGERYPTPRGLVEGEGGSVPAQMKLDQATEEECLFFVALSRAKTYARFYRYEQSAAGTNVAPSKFVEWLTEIGVNEVRANPAQVAARAVPVALSVDREVEQVPSVAALMQYERCPRRYFYTHVLELGTARHHTAFSRTHRCIQKLIEWYTDPENVMCASPDAMQQALDEIWESDGPTDHEAAAEYRALAGRLADTLLKIAPSGTAPEDARVTVKFPMGSITIEAAQIGRDGDGRAFMRRLSTGKKHKNEYSERLEYAVYRLAAEQKGLILEAVFLATNLREPVQMTDKVFRNRQNKINELLGNIRDGKFAANPDAVVCPNCPHFFVCDAVPEGRLIIS